MPTIQATNSKSIVDDLAAHIALFHSSIRTASSNPNSRKAILRWFSSLSSQQRQACLTVFDADFVKILLQMVARLKTEGLCHFFILPDLPSCSGSSLPSLCHRQLDGLLSRASASNHSERLISRCVRLFGAECDLDSMSVSEDLVKDVEVFVEVMDEISNGKFLGEADLRSSQSVWVELEWLKAKGYFSMESFISNRLELALRKSWLEHNGVKNPRSVKSRSKIASGGLGANAFWRQKGCSDWWLGLDPGVRKKVYLEFLCKGSKQLGKEFIERRFSDLKNESAPYRFRSNPISRYISVSPLKRMSQLCCSVDPNFFFGSGILSSSRKPSRLANQLNLLLVLQEVSEKFLPFSDSICENESIFFSELESVSDVSCWILRKLGWSLMSVWKEYMKIELTNDLQFNKYKIRAEEGFDKAKKKGINSKRMNSSMGSKFRENARDKEKPKSRKSRQGNFASACSSSSFPQVVIEKESLEAQTELGSMLSKHMVTVKKQSSRRRRSRSKASNCVELHVTKAPEVKVIEVDANFSKQSHQLISLGDNPLEDEALKQPISENSVSFSPVQSPCKYSQTFLEPEADKLIKNRDHRVFPGKKDKSGKDSCYKDVGDDTTLFKREKFWSEDEFDQKNMKIFMDCASTHSQLDSPMADLLHSDSSHRKQLSCCPLSLSHRGLDALKNKACSHQVIPPRVLPMSFDWPLMVRSLGSLNFDSLYNAASPSTLCSGMPNTYYQNDTGYSRDALDFCEFKSALEALDDSEGYWVSEDESNSHTWSGHDYNKLFGGGVMYWNTCDHAGTGFSHAPSQSSEDTLLAWHEAEMNQAVDDMVGNILPGNETSEEVTAISEGPQGDLHSYPVLRPIVIPNISRKGSRSEFKINMEHSSPGVSSNRKNFPRVKRPLSPVILCVPRDSRQAISYVGDSRKHRGFPVVRSGSSSPRSWGVRSCHQEEKASSRTCIRLNGDENGKHEGSPFMRSTSGSLVQERLIGVSRRDQEHPDIGIPIRSAEPCSSFDKERLSILHNLLHEEIDLFCKRVSAENLSRKPYINWAVMRVTKSLQVLWPRSRTSVFGSNATGLALPSSDVDLVVCLPPVRNLEPIKEAGILEGRNGIKETCLQHAARYLANQDWVKSDSLKTIENTAIPLIMLIAEVPCDINGNHRSHDSSDSKDSSLPNLDQPLSSRNAIAQSVRLDISFRSPTHTGLQTMELVRQLTEQFPASIPLALVLKQFLADRNLDRSYSGGLNSYCLVLLIIRFLQHEHHLFRSSNRNLGSLLMDFLYFFGNVFDPRQMHVSIQGSGIYLKRERVHCIDPIHIDDPLCPTNNVGKNCFRIHQCIKAFADAYSTMDRQLASLATGSDSKCQAPFRLLREIIPGIECEYG